VRFLGCDSVALDRARVERAGQRGTLGSSLRVPVVVAFGAGRGFLRFKLLGHG
jgi:hypothetical protein